MTGLTISIRKLITLATIAVIAVSCTEVVEDPADIIFTGEHIITMDDSRVTAVAVRGDRIVATGSEAEVLALQGPDTRLVALGERALLPGFIDAHGHFSAVARYLDFLDLSSPPVGAIQTIDDIVAAIRQRIEQQNIPPGELIFGFGYDDSLLAEGRHPDRDDLDRASTVHPIVLRHVSGHLQAGNSLALARGGISAASEDPPGGVIRRRPGSREPNGVMEETALGLLPAVDFSPARQSELNREAIRLYAGYGITTIQDANVSTDYVQRMAEDAAAEPYAVDIVTYVIANPLSDEELAAVTWQQQYTNGFRNGGIKFTLDGSPQGRTAWMSEPYLAGPPGAGADYVAYPSYDPTAWHERIARLLQRGVPVLAHANGDAAIESMIDGIDDALAGKPIPDHRAVIIHAQLIREDQLDRVQRLGIIPSYYSVHPYFWGDWHRLSFGNARAAFISPIKATVARGIPYTIHNDSPIVPPDIMRLVGISVNRTTRSGYVLGPDQRASVMEALYGVTMGAAYQYFEEDEKGSITPGKRADLVILGQDPLAIDPARLEQLPIVETFSRGVSVYRQQ